MPIGTIWPYVGDLDKIPTGWHLCDGTDGTPDLRDKFLQSYGSNAVMQTIEPGLPNITGSIGRVNLITNTPKTGPFYQTYQDTGYGHITDHGAAWGDLIFDASRANSLYKDGCNTVQPPAYTVYYIMKLS